MRTFVRIRNSRARAALASLAHMAEDYEGYLGAARMSQALFGALMRRQMQNSYASSWPLAGMSTGGGIPQDALAVITDDRSNWTAPRGQAQPGVLSRIGNAIAHPVQTTEDAWNYPGSYLADAAKGMASSAKSAATLPGDVATGNRLTGESRGA